MTGPLTLALSRSKVISQGVFGLTRLATVEAPNQPGDTMKLYGYKFAGTNEKKKLL